MRWLRKVQKVLETCVPGVMWDDPCVLALGWLPCFACFFLSTLGFVVAVFACFWCSAVCGLCSLVSVVPDKKSMEVNGDVVSQLFHLFCKSQLSNQISAYDGKNNITYIL
ncbi:hypothetical protein Q3G72_006054 [Acer saccharum]|nr:hypothetical protein Q3G72_006054 [Acer saccharum]